MSIGFFRTKMWGENENQSNEPFNSFKMIKNHFFLANWEKEKNSLSHVWLNVLDQPPMIVSNCFWAYFVCLLLLHIDFIEAISINPGHFIFNFTCNTLSCSFFCVLYVLHGTFLSISLSLSMLSISFDSHRTLDADASDMLVPLCFIFVFAFFHTLIRSHWHIGTLAH